MRALLAVLAVVAAVSTTAIGAEVRFFLHDTWKVSGLVLLSPQWLPTIGLDVACTAILRLLKT